MKKIVIIGGGVAAVNAIKAIRETDRESLIHVIQNETVHPYYRTRLTKSLFENLEEDKILLQKKEWYEQNNINLSLGNEVISIDPASNVVTLKDGSSLNYDFLLLANGASNFKPPIEGIDKANVFTIRNFADVQNIKKDIDDKKTVLHIGGGIQNLEAAWAMCTQGKMVVIAEFMDRLMPRQLDVRGSEILKNAVESSQIKVLLGTQITELTGDAAVSAARTKNDETIPCDMVIYSVGIRPNKTLYVNTPLKTNQGVQVDNRMKTNIDNIYAAGDIAEFEEKIGGLWPVAIEQGKIAGYNIAGREAVYSSLIPVTLMNAFQLSVFSIGNINENSYSLTIIDDPGDGSTYKRIFISDKIIIGAIVIGDTKSNQLLKRFVESKTPLTNIDLTNITVDDLLLQLKNL